MKPWCNLIFTLDYHHNLDWWTVPRAISLLREQEHCSPGPRIELYRLASLPGDFLSIHFLWKLIVTGAGWAQEANCVVTGLVTRGPQVTDHVWSARPGQWPHPHDCLESPPPPPDSQQCWPRGQQRVPPSLVLPGWFNRHWHLTMEKHNTQLPVGHIKTWSKHKLSPTPGNCE